MQVRIVIVITLSRINLKIRSKLRSKFWNSMKYLKKIVKKEITKFIRQLINKVFIQVNQCLVPIFIIIVSTTHLKTSYIKNNILYSSE